MMNNGDGGIDICKQEGNGRSEMCIDNGLDDWLNVTVDHEPKDKDGVKNEMW